jgi:Protein of unknown function (DUF2846)
MGRHYRIVIAFSIAVQLAACAGPLAIESQSRTQDSRLSRLYFLRQKAVIGTLGGTVPAADIKVDGKKVGAVTNGSYFFVDRPPGLHQLSAENGMSLAYETEVQVEAGKSYYFNLGTPGTGKWDRTCESDLCRRKWAADAAPIPVERRVFRRRVLQS